MKDCYFRKKLLFVTMGMERKWNICSQMWHAFTPHTIHSYFTAGFHFFIVLQFLRNTQNHFMLMKPKKVNVPVLSKVVCLTLKRDKGKKNKPLQYFCLGCSSLNLVDVCLIFEIYSLYSCAYTVLYFTALFRRDLLE